MDGVSVIDPLDVVGGLVGNGAIGIVAYQLSKALRTVWVERSKRKTMLAILDKMVELGPEHAEHLRARLERVRPPPPDQLQPPAAS
jgi:hypothetical protein